MWVGCPGLADGAWVGFTNCDGGDAGSIVGSVGGVADRDTCCPSRVQAGSRQLCVAVIAAATSHIRTWHAQMGLRRLPGRNCGDLLGTVSLRRKRARSASLRPATVPSPSPSIQWWPPNPWYRRGAVGRRSSGGERALRLLTLLSAARVRTVGRLRPGQHRDRRRRYALSVNEGLSWIRPVTWTSTRRGASPCSGPSRHRGPERHLHATPIPAASGCPVTGNSVRISTTARH
jgi:hypothetical protein